MIVVADSGRTLQVSPQWASNVPSVSGQLEAVDNTRDSESAHIGGVSDRSRFGIMGTLTGMSTRAKLTGGRTAYWGDRAPYTIRVPVGLKNVIETAASRTGVPLATHSVIVLADHVGVGLSPSGGSTDAFEAFRLGIRTVPRGRRLPRRPRSSEWGPRAPGYNLRMPIDVRDLLKAAAKEAGLSLAEYSIVVLAEAHGFTLLGQDKQEHQLQLQVSA